LQAFDIEFHHSRPVIVWKLFNAVLCFGLSNIQICELLGGFGMNVPTKNHFYAFQGQGLDGSVGWIATVLQVWAK
jgi:hypothetical protein